MTISLRGLLPVLLGAAMMLSQVPAHATADGPDYYRVKEVAAWDVLNMRAGPAASYQIVHRIPHNGRLIENLGGHVGRWTQVRFDGVVGWVHSRYLAEDAPDEAWPEPGFRVVGVAWNDVLNVRAGPAASYQIVGALMPGATGVMRAGTCVGSWCQIAHGNIHGWVNMRFLAPEL